MKSLAELRGSVAAVKYAKMESANGHAIRTLCHILEDLLERLQHEEDSLKMQLRDQIDEARERQRSIIAYHEPWGEQ